MGPRTTSEASCDARPLKAGEVRARQIPCSDELIPGGEGRVGDWLIENAQARFVIRGTYAALTSLREEGGTLIDAAAPDGPDLLLEYVPDADRTGLYAEQGEGEAVLVSQGVTWRLTADSASLAVEGPSGGTLQGLPGVERTGATLAEADAFFGADGSGRGMGSVVSVDGNARVALSREALWPDGADVDADVDADSVVVLVDGDPVARMDVVDGRVVGRVPASATLLGEREGCVYESLTLLGCGSLRIRVADNLGRDLPSTLTDGVQSWPVPKGGGAIPVGPDPRSLRLWAGPRYSVGTVYFAGGDSTVGVTLMRELDDPDVVLAALNVEVAPDATTVETAREAGHRLVSEGVEFAAIIADDEVPTAEVDEHDGIVLTAGSRAGALVASWPWSPNSKRAAHGAVDWEGLTALALLAVSEGGESLARRTLVDATWVARARGEAETWRWDPRPDALWLADLGSLPTYLALVDDRVDIAPVGPRTWIDVDADHNLVAYEAGIVDARTSAGNGPRIRLVALNDGRVGVDLEAPGWMAMEEIVIWTNLGEANHPVDGPGNYRFDVGAADWAVGVAEGARARPDSGERAWTVSAPLWIHAPGDEDKAER